MEVVQIEQKVVKPWKTIEGLAYINYIDRKEKALCSQIKIAFSIICIVFIVFLSFQRSPDNLFMLISWVLLLDTWYKAL